MKILWCSNAPFQPTGYGRIARELVPRINKNTEHEVVMYCVSGLLNAMPFMYEGVKMYGNTIQGGMLGMYDVPMLRKMEKIDLVHLNFDAWAVNYIIGDWRFSYTLYPPVDHDPLPLSWYDVMKKADLVVPYCKFGDRVIRESGVDEKKLYHPIYHGVDVKLYTPGEDERSQLFGVKEDAFVVGVFKNNQGTRANFQRMLRAFNIFLDDVGDEKPILYIHSAIQGKNSFDLPFLIKRLRLEDNVRIVPQNRYLWGVTEEDMVRLYNSIDVLLNCTCGEGFGFPIVEAFACKKPVIASGYSSMPELLNDKEGEIEREKDGDFVVAERGLLVGIHDVECTLGKHSWRRQMRAESIAAALKYAYENRDEMKKKGEKGRKFVEKYSWDKIAEEWYKFFDFYDEEFFREDEAGIPWKKVDHEFGGVGGFEG